MMQVTFWGTRGSLPTPGTQFVRHGGATSCIEVELDGADGQDTPQRIVFDCGSGLAQLGRVRGPGCERALILQTHMHWDHIQGFPFFAPLFNPKASFALWGVPREGQSFEQILSAQMRSPFFPVSLDNLPATLHFRSLAPMGEDRFGDLLITWVDVCHPSGSSAYRLDYGGTSLVYTGDVEVAKGSADAIVQLASGADLLIMEAQYLPEEYAQREGFGHSTCLEAVEMAQRAKVGRLIMTHHDPAHDDGRLDQKRESARWAAGGLLCVENAHDGQQTRV